jgi:acetyltransferase
LAVDERVLDGALRQCGVLRVRSIDELVNTLLGFQWMPLPRGPRVALVTYSGAQAILSIDRAEEVGLKLARFSEETQKRISTVITSPSKSRNPVDLFPDMMVHGFEKTSTEILRALLDGEEVDSVVFISFALQGAAPYQPVVELLDGERPKPVFFALLGTKEDVESCRAFLERHRVPSTLFPEAAVETLARMWRYARIRRET